MYLKWKKSSNAERMKRKKKILYQTPHFVLLTGRVTAFKKTNRHVFIYYKSHIDYTTATLSRVAKKPPAILESFRFFLSNSLSAVIQIIHVPTKYRMYTSVFVLYMLLKHYAIHYGITHNHNIVRDIFVQSDGIRHNDRYILHLYIYIQHIPLFYYHYVMAAGVFTMPYIVYNCVVNDVFILL